MSMTTRQELTEEVTRRYGTASRPDKRRILDEFIALTGYHRKHALRLLNHPEAARPSRQPRTRLYDEAVHQALIIVWEAADRICGKRLKAILPILVEAMERHGHLQLGAELRARLLGISASTIDRLLMPQRTATSKRRRRSQNSGLLRSQIPVRTFADWGDPLPGYMEVDMVAHNGGNSEGSFIHTLVLTDIASGWTECIPLLVREQGLVVEAVEIVRDRLPFALLGLDTDNDGAFINNTLLTYTRKAGLTQTRSRPYRKNDQAWVEQKNGAVVRRLVGYERFQGISSAQVLSQLYEVARLHVNYFQPSFKLKAKHRDGAKVTKHYHPPATPCERLLATQALDDAQKQALREQAHILDPLRLLQDVRKTQSALVRFSAPRETAPASASEDLADFLAHLPTLWRQGEARPTHQQPARPVRNWRTRVDPFASVWPRVEEWLVAEPDATAKALFHRLQTEYPQTFPASQLRTLQRRVREWRQTMARTLIFGTQPLAKPTSDQPGDDATAAVLRAG